MYRASYIENVFQVFDFHRAIDAQIRARAGWQRIIYGHIHCYGTVLHGRVDARNMPRNYAVACVDSCLQSDCNVFRLGFGDFDFRL